MNEALLRKRQVDMQLAAQPRRARAPRSHPSSRPTRGDGQDDVDDADGARVRRGTLHGGLKAATEEMGMRPRMSSSRPCSSSSMRTSRRPSTCSSLRL